MTAPATSATMAQLSQNGCALSQCSMAPQLRNSVAIECGCAGCAPSRAQLRAPLSPQLRSAGAALSLRHRYAQLRQSNCTSVRWPSAPNLDMFACMTNTAVAQTGKKTPRERPIGRKLQQAIDLLLDGTCKSQKAVCDRLKLSPSYLSRSMKSERIRAFIARRTSETIAAGQLAATATVLRLVESARSEHVMFDAAKHVLGLNGHRVAEGNTVNVTLGEGARGYIVMLGNPDAEVYEGEVTAGVGGVLFGRPKTAQELRDGVEERSLPNMVDVTPRRDER